MKIEKINGNTYMLRRKGISSCSILYMIDDKNCIIIDPGHLSGSNFKEFNDFLKNKKLIPKYLIASHGHLDHANAIPFLYEEYKSKIIMPEYEAFYFESPKYYQTAILEAKNENYEKIYPNKKMEIDYIIKKEEKYIEIENIKFEVIPLPGHAFNHCGFVTEDDVFYLSDTLMTEDIINKTKIPYIYNIKEDIETKRRILDYNYKYVIASHDGYIYDMKETIKINLEFLNKYFNLIMSYLEKPLSYEEINRKINKDFKIGKEVIKYIISERSVRGFVSYLEKNNYIESYTHKYTIYYRKKENFENITI